MAKWSKSEKSWERQPKESVQAYEALNLYLSMGAERTLHKVATKLSKSDTLIKRWSSSWNWQQRSRDYDNDLKRKEFDEMQKQIKTMQKRQMQTAVLLQKKAVEALDKLDIEDLSPQEILRFISEGAKLERETRQESALTSAREAGATSERSSIADTIIAAYEKRKGDGNA
ncbi:MAG: hypothetical protein LUG26_07605 [Ruminococcus sp.]|nr:hypothetical protein [Ruminococcus sp.]